MKKYYLIENDIQKGPFTYDELKQLSLNKDTLLWSDDMEDWTELKDIYELKDLLLKAPPPIPKKRETISKIEAEVSKKRSKTIDEKDKILVAKEVKRNFQLMKYPLIIGIVSIVIFYFVIYNVPKYNNYDLSKVHGNEHYASGWPDNDDLGLPLLVDNPKDLVQQRIKFRKEDLTIKTFVSALYVTLISAGLLLLFKYIFKGAKWINDTAKT